MVSFWIYMVLMIVIASVFVVFPFIRKEKQQLTSVSSGENAQRITIYQQKLAELDDELQLEKISDGDYQQAVIELKKGLLTELSPEKNLTVKGSNRTLLMAASLFLLSFCLVFYYNSGNHPQLKQWEKAKASLTELGQRAMGQEGKPLTKNEMQEFALALRTKLAEQGDDEMAWMILGQVVMSLGDYKMAMQAFDKTLAMNPKNVSVLLSYTQLILINGQPDYARAAKMLDTVLSVEPTNFDAISLLGLIAYEKGDLIEAHAAFEVLLASLTPKDERYEMIKGRVADLEQKIAASPVLAKRLQAQQAAQTDVNKNIQNSAGQTNAITVTIQLAEHLSDKIPDDATLFVFAKAATGPKMPLAVVKKRQFEFPITVTLSQENAMVAELSLAQFEQVSITARVSIDENVMSAKGELQGNSDIVTVATSPEVMITVDQLL